MSPPVGVLFVKTRSGCTACSAAQVEPPTTSSDGDDSRTIRSVGQGRSSQACGRRIARRTIARGRATRRTPSVPARPSCDRDRDRSSASSSVEHHRVARSSGSSRSVGSADRRAVQCRPPSPPFSQGHRTSSGHRSRQSSVATQIRPVALNAQWATMLMPMRPVDQRTDAEHDARRRTARVARPGWKWMSGEPQGRPTPARRRRSTRRRNAPCNSPRYNSSSTSGCAHHDEQRRARPARCRRRSRTACGPTPRPSGSTNVSGQIASSGQYTSRSSTSWVRTPMGMPEQIDRRERQAVVADRAAQPVPLTGDLQPDQRRDPQRRAHRAIVSQIGVSAVPASCPDAASTAAPTTLPASQHTAQVAAATPTVMRLWPSPRRTALDGAEGTGVPDETDMGGQGTERHPEYGRAESVRSGAAGCGCGGRQPARRCCRSRRPSPPAGGRRADPRAATRSAPTGARRDGGRGRSCAGRARERGRRARRATCRTDRSTWRRPARHIRCGSTVGTSRTRY